MDLAAYLNRVGHAGPVRADLETLRALHRAHGLAIPYENFDVQLKRLITTDPAAAFEKLVTRKRGGWCYEMNGTFGLVLEAIGFKVTRLAGDGAEPASHLVLTVDLDGETYVADVGFADGPIEPYPLVEGPFSQGGFDYRVEFLEGGRWQLHNHKFGAVPGFSAVGPDEGAMAERCQYLQTSPESAFVQNTTVFRRNAEGFISLIGRTLRTITPAGVAKEDVPSAEAYVATLKDRFGLDLPETASLWPVICSRHEQYLRAAAARRAKRE